MSRRATHLLHPENKHQRTSEQSENIRTVREHQNSQRTSEQSENIRPTTVRTFKLSPIEMKKENKKLFYTKKN